MIDVLAELDKRVAMLERTSHYATSRARRRSGVQLNHYADAVSRKEARPKVLGILWRASDIDPGESAWGIVRGV